MKQPSNRRNDWRSRWVLWRALLALGPFASMVLVIAGPVQEVLAKGGHVHP